MYILVCPLACSLTGVCLPFKCAFFKKMQYQWGKHNAELKDSAGTLETCQNMRKKGFMVTCP